MTNIIAVESSLPIDKYLTHFWPITDGNLSDVAGSAHMIQGDLTSFVEDRFCNVNSALALNGFGTQVPAGIYFDTPAFTILVWVYPSNISSGSIIIDFGNGFSTDQITLVFSDSTKQSPALTLPQSSSWQNAISPQPLALNQWQYLAVTFNGTNARFYLNGNLTDDILFSYTLHNVSRSNCYIGKSNCADDGYSHSYLDDLRFYSKCLTQEEIIQLMISQNEPSNYIYVY
jgi:hypothetical protein